MRYNLKRRKEDFKKFEKRVGCVMQKRGEGKSFQGIADACGLSTRQQAFHIYQDNKADHAVQK